jgi:hypothetical protein
MVPLLRFLLDLLSGFARPRTRLVAGNLLLRQQSDPDRVTDGGLHEVMDVTTARHRETA